MQNQIRQVVADFARKPNGGIIVAASPGALINQKLIIDVAAKHRLPAVYFQKEFVKGGGLISYGPDVIAQYGHAATYVDEPPEQQRAFSSPSCGKLNVSLFVPPGDDLQPSLSHRTATDFLRRVICC